MSIIKDNPEFKKYEEAVQKASELVQLIDQLCQNQNVSKALEFEEYKSEQEKFSKLVENLENDTLQIKDIHKISLTLCYMALLDYKVRDLHLGIKSNDYLSMFKQRFNAFKQTSCSHETLEKEISKENQPKLSEGERQIIENQKKLIKQNTALRIFLGLVFLWVILHFGGFIKPKEPVPQAIYYRAY